MIITVAQVFVLIGTIGIGLLSFAAPAMVAGFTQLDIPAARGRTEVRAIFGGLFIGLGVAPLILGSKGAYAAVGLIYLAIGAGRLLAMVLDRSWDQSNWISLIVEIAFGFLLLL